MESHIVNSTLVLKKKGNVGGPVYFNDQPKKDGVINNHHLAIEAPIWRRPSRPVTQVYSNHKGQKFDILRFFSVIFLKKLSSRKNCNGVLSLFNTFLSII